MISLIFKFLEKMMFFLSKNVFSQNRLHKGEAFRAERGQRRNLCTRHVRMRCIKSFFFFRIKFLKKFLKTKICEYLSEFVVTKTSKQVFENLFSKKRFLVFCKLDFLIHYK